MKKVLLLFFTLFNSVFLFCQESCENALPVSIDIVYSVEDITGDAIDDICFDNNGNDGAWYTFVPSISDYYNITTDLVQNSGLDPRLSVLSGNCESGFECVGYDDDSGSGFLSHLNVLLEEGVTYYITWDDHWSDYGFDFIIKESTAPPITDQAFTSQTIDITGNIGIAAVDMNGDFLDDIVSVSTSFIDIHYQQEDGSFIQQIINTSESENLPSWSMAVGDLNGDYYNDLLLGGGSGNSFLLSQNDGSTFEHYSSGNYVFSQRTNMADINNDGLLDAFSCHDVRPNVYYISDAEGDLNYFQGGMGDFPSGGNYGSIFVDYDNDGDSDLFIAKCRGGNSGANINEMHRNNGNGTYTEVAEEIGMADPIQTWSSAWGDFNNDGFMDALVGANSLTNGSHKLMMNNGNGQFINETAGSGFTSLLSGSREFVAHDFDNNGWIDVFTGVSGGTIMLNQGDGTFVPRDDVPSRGAVADLNNDGKLDFYHGNTISYNTFENNYNWLKVATLGTESNTNGIGARIEVYTDSGMQIRDVRSGDGFEFMSSLNAHFGLGENNTIDHVVIKWPSGIVDTYYEVDINNTLYSVEGETLSTNEHDIKRNKLVVYPVPSSDFVTIKSTIELLKQVTITSVNGKSFQSEVKNNQINVQNLPIGIYYLKLQDVEGNVYNEKILVN